VVCDAGGVIAQWGNAAQVIFPRSAYKMLQALPLVESGAADAAGLGVNHLALSCASHQGAHMHTDLARDWLAGLGLGEADLRCGPQVPNDFEARALLKEKPESPCQFHNNCSGKHSGFLTLNKHLGGGAEYIELNHPVQKAVKAAFEEMIDFLSERNAAAALALEGRRDDLLAFHRLDVSSTLNVTFLSTNNIENAFRNWREVSGNVKRWREKGDMISRWVASGMLWAEAGFRKIRHAEDLGELATALSTCAPAASLRSEASAPEDNAADQNSCNPDKQ